MLEAIVMPKVKVNDVQVYYEIRGEGFPLVMINGLGLNLNNWDPRLVEGLSRRFKLVMFDNRGAGRTGASDREYTLRLFADDVAGLMDALGIPRAYVLGASMGGMVAQELVLNYPERVSKLVLCSTRSGGVKDILPSREVIRRVEAGVNILSKEEWRRIFLPLMFTDDFVEENPDFVEGVVQRFFEHPISEKAHMRQLIALQNFSAYDRLWQIESPTLILHGRRDVLIPPQNGSVLADVIPKARVVFFERSAHVLAEEMNEVLSVLADFLT